MAASTTLMTFRVRTPPTTRSVTLYGSWDNFTTPYVMSQDTRLGKEHWTGCHSFANIICDGNGNESGVSRNGGLRMGGTYWYYYELDDEIDFHNSAEPSTTWCPMLPGQLVNVLQVPFALSGSRKRDASVSSTSSEHRTMDPDDKFMNPRPVPPPPAFSRLKTSPLSATGSMTVNSSPLGPASASYLTVDRSEDSPPSSSILFPLPRKTSLDTLLKASSSKPNSAGLRPPFRKFGSERSCSPAGFRDIVNWEPREMRQEAESEECRVQTPLLRESPVTREGRNPVSRPRPPPGALLLRSQSAEEMITLSSFSEHRRQQSRSRSRGSSSRNSTVLDESAHLDLSNAKAVEPTPLSTLIEVNTPDKTPCHGPKTGRRIALEALEGKTETNLRLEKRLPTLPNTPSSAYPPSLLEKSPPRHSISHVTDLNSRFSSTTIDTTCHLNSIILDEQQCSHFLDFAGASDWSPTSPNTLAENIDSPSLVQECDNSIFSSASSGMSTFVEDIDVINVPQSRTFSSNMSFTTISSAVSSRPSTSYGDPESIDQGYYVATSTSAHSSPTQLHPIQHYSLPELENSSQITLKRYNGSNHNLTIDGDFKMDNEPAHNDNNTIVHSEGMRQLLDELSYLSAMIQN